MQKYVGAALLAALALTLAACSGGTGYTPAPKPPVERTSTPKAMVTVPDVVGMNADAAQRSLATVGLELSADTASLDALAVVDTQDPAAGEEVEEGEWVYVTVTEPTPTPTPTPEPERLAADDPARVGLEAQFGLIFTDESWKKLRDQYCTMTDQALLSTGEYVADTVRDVTPAKFVLWIAEKCGR